MRFAAYPSSSRTPTRGRRARTFARAQPRDCSARADRTVIFDPRMIIGVTRAAAASGVFKYRKYLCLENWKAKGAGVQTRGRGLFINSFCQVFAQRL